MRLKVKVKPSSKREGVREVSPGELEVRVSAPPEKERANERLIELLAKHYGVRKGAVRILRGETSREKVVEIDL